jgi:proteasome-associated ATPase
MSESKRPAGKLSTLKSTLRKLQDQLAGSEADLPGYRREIERLQQQIRTIEDELQKTEDSRNQLDQAHRQNEKLIQALQEAREQIEALRQEVEKLTAPPSSFSVFSEANTDGTVNVYVAGRKMKVNVHPSVKVPDLRRGQQLILNEALNVVEVRDFELQGEVVRLKDLLEDRRAIVMLRADEERVAEIAASLDSERLSVGDHLLFDTRSGYILEKLPKAEVEELVLEEVPDVSYEQIGGLSDQIEQIRDAVELPVLHRELFAEYRLAPPKGVLLYGPPGCGKTLIAKAVANSIAKKMGHASGREVKSYFLHVKGPELLNKYVGESERQIREVFKKARDKAQEGMPVIVFFDEMDSLFRTRGTGISSDVESTIVPQFLAEIDGVERLRNVIVIGASNRQDLIDPAVLRPGRLDVKIRIDRPDRRAAKDIFGKYLTSDLPYHNPNAETSDALIGALIDRVVDQMYGTSEDNRFLEVTYANGEKETLYFKDFVSGALIEGVVSRSKKYAIKRTIANGERGIRIEDLLKAARDEFREHEDLPNTTNPDDWAKIAGRKSEKIMHVRTVTGRATESRAVETVTTGHYL